MANPVAEKRHLVVGKSGSGKTVLVNRLISVRKYKILYLINCKDSGDYELVKKKTVQIDFNQLDSISKNSVVVIEDVINLSHKENDKLRNLLNYQCHHLGLTVFCVTHSVHKTNLYGTLSFFDAIWVTRSAANSRTASILFDYFKLDSTEKSFFTAKLQITKPDYDSFVVFVSKTYKLHLVISLSDLLRGDVSASNFVTADSMTHEVSSQELFKQKLGTFLADFPRKDLCLAIFEILIHCLSPNDINPVDLTITLKNSSGTKMIKCSLVDYLTSVVTPDAGSDKNLQLLHEYISSQCTIPNILIQNSSFS